MSSGTEMQYDFIEDAIQDAMKIVVSDNAGVQLSPCLENTNYSCISGTICAKQQQCSAGAFGLCIQDISHAKRTVGGENWTKQAEAQFWIAFACLRKLAGNSEPLTGPSRWFKAKRLLRSFLFTVFLFVGPIIIAPILLSRDAIATFNSSCTSNEITNICLADAESQFRHSFAWWIKDKFTPDGSDGQEDPIKRKLILKNAMEEWLGALQKLFPFYLGALGAYIGTRNRWLSDANADNVMRSMVADQRLQRRALIGSILGGIAGTVVLWGAPVAKSEGSNELLFPFILAFAVGFQTKGIVKFLEELSDRIESFLVVKK